MSVKELLGLVEQGRLIIGCGWQQPLGWGPRLNKMEKVN